ncbi:MAG: c-type cytochrome [Gammaproteobacteria bacterium SHHR-1]|uniref:c-type cytochrome n=1 Tax=Magnetovirga frankeli TaxID=947516 RepID=UPI0012932D30|nr:cytochrome c5 family protein [gamma proteobacterium SS-5]
MFAQSVAGLALGAALALSFSSLHAEDRSEVLQRIKPVGQVAITGQPEPAPAKQAEQPTAAAAAKAEPVQAAPAEDKQAAAASEGAKTASSGESIYNTKCMACHMTGAAGAPKLEDKANWEPRIAKGMDALYQSAFNGTAKGMPPRGTCMECSDDELKATVDYMVQQASN